MNYIELTESEREQIGEILKRRANDIASFKSKFKDDELPGSAELGLAREIQRIRRLENRVNPPKPCLEDEE